MDEEDVYFPFPYSSGDESNIQTYAPYAAQVAEQNGVPVDLFLAQIYQESSFNPNPAPNPSSSASGIAQFINGTAALFGINTSDPYASLAAAAQYDAQLYNSSGSWSQVMSSYGTGTSSQNVSAALGELGTTQTGATTSMDFTTDDLTGNSPLAYTGTGGIGDMGDFNVNTDYGNNYDALDQQAEQSEGIGNNLNLGSSNNQQPAASSSSTQGIVTQFEKWASSMFGGVTTSVENFFVRGSIVTLGILLVIGAVYLLGKSGVSENVNK